MTSIREPHAPGGATDQPTVVHCVTEFLSRTETWIYSQIMWNRDFRHMILCRRRVFPDEFPWDEVLVRKPPRGLQAGIMNFLREKDPATTEAVNLRPFQPRLIHAHYGWEGYRNLNLRRRLGVPMVTTFYGLDASKLPRRWWWRRRYPELFREGDLFLTEGPHMKGRLVALGAPEEKTLVIALGIDLERVRFQPRTPVAEPRILMAASFREKKGHRYAVEAFRRIAERFPTVRLEFIGHGPLRPAIRKQIPLHLIPRATFHGSSSYDRYLELLGEASILLAPSVTASDGDTEGGAPVCLLEAQASGIPIVATTHCDIPNVIHPAGREFLVPERDPEALADALAQLLENPSRWERLGDDGRRWAADNFDVRKQAAKIAAAYRRLLQ